MSRPSYHWLITDTHYFQRRERQEDYFGRPMNCEEIIQKNLRMLVAEQDYLIHLGDVIFDQYHRLAELLGQIHCRGKYLVLGNHDKKSRSWYMANGFDGVFDALQIKDVYLSHKPVQHFPSGVRLNIHGHFHNTDYRRHEPEYVEWYDESRHRLLAIEETGLKPVRLDLFAAEKKPAKIACK